MGTPEATPQQPQRPASDNPVQSSEPSDPPPLSVSEAMRRIQALLSASKLTTSDLVTFNIKNFSFTAHILQDGSLKAQPPSKPETASSHPGPGYKLYSSPSEFASDMAASALLLDDKAAKPRGKLSINGWDDCLVRGRTLSAIRNEMLRERKNESAGVSGPDPGLKDSQPGTEKPSDDYSTNQLDNDRENKSQQENLAPDRGVPPKSERTNADKDDQQRNLDTIAKSGQSGEGTPVEPVSKESSQSKVAGDVENANDECPADASKAIPSREVREPDAKSDGYGLIDPSTSGTPEELDEGRGSDAQTGNAQEERERDVAVRSVQVETARQKLSGILPSRSEAVGRTPSSQTVNEEASAPHGIPIGENDQQAGEVFSTKHHNEDAQDGAKPYAKMEIGAKLKIRQPTATTVPPNEASEANAEDGAEKTEVTSKRDETLTRGFGAEDGGIGENFSRERGATSEPKNSKPMQSSAGPAVHSEKEAPAKESSDKEHSSDGVPNLRSKPEANKSRLGTADTPKKEDQGDADQTPSPKPKSPDPFPVREESTIEPALDVPPEHPSRKVEDLQQEILGDSDSDIDSSSAQEKAQQKTSKKRSRSPLKQDSRKRKRAGGSVSSPRDGNTPSRRSPDQSLPKPESARPTRRLDIRSANDMDAADLDPEAMAAAAIAAQIEKEEANSRARRTTRLAAGKIKQVDYKASANAQGSRSLSPGQDFEDVDGLSNGNDSASEPLRSTRRKNAQGSGQVPQRSSRRVARLRNTQERDHSSNEDRDVSAGRSSSRGTGSDGREDKDAIGNMDDMDVDSGPGIRLNGIKADGQERRRGRNDGTLKRTRHSSNEDGDYDSAGRAYSTRASTRENSVVDVGEVRELGDPSELLGGDEEIEEGDSPDERTDANGFNTLDLTCIGTAVRSSDSVDSNTIVDALLERDDWKADDAKNKKAALYLRKMIDCLKEVPSMTSSDRGDIQVDDVLSFIAADIWRLRTGGLNTGFPRKPSSIHKRTSKEEHLKSSLERSRRKEHRDVEELRATLEKEMESRRRAELDTSFVEIQVFEANRALSREKALCWRVERETEKYRGMEGDARDRLERTKILVGQLRGERDNPDEMTGNAKKEPLPEENIRQDNRQNGGFEKRQVGAPADSTTSDDDVEMTDKNITTTSQRLLEMDRLRVLIAAREAEAEGFQRMCEKERMRFVAALDVKNRLETEIYLYKSHGSSAHGAGGSSISPMSNKMSKDASRKAEHRSSGTGGNRGTVPPRAKNSSSKTGNTPSTSTTARLATSSKPKPGPARSNGDAAKSAKRKTTGKANGATEKS